MSGGRYDYLYAHVENKANELIAMLEPMAERLTEIAPDHPVTNNTSVAVEALTKICSILQKSSEVYHAVEWFDSLDWDWEAVQLVLEKYK